MAKYTEEELEQILEARSESANLDFKRAFNWDNDKECKLEVVKDILSMANTKNGGRVIVGVEDNGDVAGVSDEDIKSFDQTNLHNFLHKYTDPKFTVNVDRPLYKEKSIVIIGIPEFDEEPILCRENASNSSGKQILKEGGLYIRTNKGSSELIPSSSEMRELLSRAIMKKSDYLLNQIERLLTGRPSKKEKDITQSEEKEDFAIKESIKEARGDNYDAELQKAEEYIEKEIGDELVRRGYWEIVVKPKRYKKDFISDVVVLRKDIEEQRVQLRGWDFPHIDRDDFVNANGGVQSWTKFLPKHVSAFRFYQSGLFVYKNSFWEDGREGDDIDKVLKEFSFIGAIYSMTEIFLFIKQFYIDKIKYDDELDIKIILHKTDGRELKSYEPMVIWFGGYTSREPTIILEDTISAIKIQSSWKEIANDFCMKMFHIFNWNDVSFQIIEKWQDKLLNREF
ncbi:MAG: ATP-binding protein [Patescibacteria group bacterium]|nr:ATP-binding protein [Patescibacteria group bacterium]